MFDYQTILIQCYFVHIIQIFVFEAVYKTSLFSTQNKHRTLCVTTIVSLFGVIVICKYYRSKINLNFQQSINFEFSMTS